MKREESDKSNMKKIILDFPKQFRSGIEAAKNVFLKSSTFSRPPENIIVCGMGGSGIPADILVTLRPLDIFPYKSYHLPLQAGNESLIICISYSGDTEETLSSFQTAIDRKLPVIAITTGGKLGELARKYHAPLAKIPELETLPRLALGEMFAALVQILQNHNLLEEGIVKEILKHETSLKPRELEPLGKKLAGKFFKKIPIIYTSRSFREIGLIWKNCLNESAKILTIVNYFPESDHNEIVGFSNKVQIENKKLHVVILRDKKESHPRILKQMEIFKDLVEAEGTKVEFIDMKGKTILEKIFSSVILGFWTAYWLALKYKIDPSTRKPIEKLKLRLEKK